MSETSCAYFNVLLDRGLPRRVGSRGRLLQDVVDAAVAASTIRWWTAMRLPSYQELSKEQDKINNLPLDGSYLVTGPPGTGKTVMALYRAQMLSKRERTGASADVLAAALAVHGERHQGARHYGVVRTFLSWFYSFYRQHYRHNPPEVERWVYDWTDILISREPGPAPAESLPYLLIDEGQDLAGALLSGGASSGEPPHRLRRRESAADGAEFDARRDPEAGRHQGTIRAAPQLPEHTRDRDACRRLLHGPVDWCA